jgi:hypothetical protein
MYPCITETALPLCQHNKPHSDGIRSTYRETNSSFDLVKPSVIGTVLFFLRPTWNCWAAIPAFLFTTFVEAPFCTATATPQTCSRQLVHSHRQMCCTTFGSIRCLAESSPELFKSHIQYRSRAHGHMLRSNNIGVPMTCCPSRIMRLLQLERCTRAQDIILDCVQ